MTDPDLYEWLALRRVQEGGVATSAAVYLDHGRRTPEYLTAALDQLVWTGLATVAQGDPLWELRRLSLTDAGQTRYAALCAQRQTPLAASPPEHGSQTWGVPGEAP